MYVTKVLSMKELLRTNDITVIAYANAILNGSGIDLFELDVNISMMEGCVGILPHRLMVREGDLALAQSLMCDHGVSLN